jgi:hypothetical protein
VAVFVRTGGKTEREAEPLSNNSAEKKPTKKNQRIGTMS